jgi:hypothetical protein
MSRIGIIGTLVAVVLVSAIGAQSPLRTEWGDPDLEGVWLSANPDGLPFQRVADQVGDDALLYELVDAAAIEAGLINEGVPAAPRLTERLFTLTDWRRTHAGPAALVVDPADGRIPPLTAEGRSRLASWRSTVRTAGPWNQASDFGPVERCISRGPLRSMLPTYDYPGIEIVQAPGVVVIRTEVIHEARVIPLASSRDSAQPRLGEAVRSYMGDSRGYWDEDTLVVETTNFNGRAGAHLNGNETPMSGRLTLSERFRRVDEETIDYTVTVDDPGTWTAPWTVAVTIARAPADYVMAEYACHEGNYALRGVLSAARATER